MPGNRETAKKNLQKADRAKAHRPKGSKNKVPYDLVKRIIKIEQDLAEKGKGLADCAMQKPMWFLEHFVKPIIPKNVDLGTSKTIEEILLELARKRESRSNN